MGFVQRAFTPPGTGGQEAAAEAAPQIAAQQQLMAQVEARRIANMPTAPQAPNPPAAPQQFMPGSAPGAKARSQATASILGRAAGATQVADRKSPTTVLG